MGKFLKFTGIGCGGFIALLVALAVVGSSASRTTTITGTPAATSPSTAGVPAKPAGRPVAAVGQRIESAGVALTVNGVSKAKNGGPLMPAKDGKTYLVVDVTVENANRDKAPYNPLYFKVKDADGFEYTATLLGASMDRSLQSGELASGEKARGTVAFEVPAGAKGFVSSYQPLVIFGGYEVLRVALGD